MSGDHGELFALESLQLGDISIYLTAASMAAEAATQPDGFPWRTTWLLRIKTSVLPVGPMQVPGGPLGALQGRRLWDPGGRIWDPGGRSLELKLASLPVRASLARAALTTTQASEQTSGSVPMFSEPTSGSVNESPAASKLVRGSAAALKSSHGVVSLIGSTTIPGLMRVSMPLFGSTSGSTAVSVRGSPAVSSKSESGSVSDSMIGSDLSTVQQSFSITDITALFYDRYGICQLMLVQHFFFRVSTATLVYCQDRWSDLSTVLQSFFIFKAFLYCQYRRYQLLVQDVFHFCQHCSSLFFQSYSSRLLQIQQSFFIISITFPPHSQHNMHHLLLGQRFSSALPPSFIISVTDIIYCRSSNYSLLPAQKLSFVVSTAGLTY